MAQLLLGGAELPEALTLTARRVAEAIGAPSASIELGSAPARARTVAIGLRDGDVQVGTLVVPDDLPPAGLQRLRAQILPALTSIVVAALARHRLQAEVVETASLRRSDEMKTAVLRSVSHDLRTPMTAILAGIAALRACGLTDDERDANLAGIDEGATRLGRLIEKLLKVERAASRGA
jgi:two-component system sensor histidine kinase KdpD